MSLEEYVEFKWVCKDQEVVCRFPAHRAIDDIMSEFKQFLLACGYHPDSVDGFFEEMKND